jgi:myosin heavy subunit
VVGIMGLTDDEVKGTRNDERLADRINDLLHERSGNSSKRRKVKHGDLRYMFTVMHFAGPVEYSARGFVDKNSDKAPEGIAECFAQSSRSILAGLGGIAAHGGGGRSASRVTSNNRRSLSMANRSLLSKLRSNFDELNRQLSATEPHFVRCVKPNTIKAPMLFDASMVLTQVRYSGVSEVCRVRKHGFPSRISFEDFGARYPLIQGITNGLPPSATPGVCKRLAAAGILQDGRWLVGKSKVFLKQDQLDRLEAARYGVVKRIVVLQSVARTVACKSRYASYKLVANGLQKGTKSKKLELLEGALETWQKFTQLYPTFPVATFLYTDAVQLRTKLRECAAQSAILEEQLRVAEEARDLSFEERQPVADSLERAMASLEPIAEFLSSKARASRANAAMLVDVLRTKPPTPPPTPPPSPPASPVRVEAVPVPVVEVVPVPIVDERKQQDGPNPVDDDSLDVIVEEGAKVGVHTRQSSTSTTMSHDTDRVQEELELLRAALQRKLDTIEVRLRETEHVIRSANQSEASMGRPKSVRGMNGMANSSLPEAPKRDPESGGGCCVVM